MFVCILHCDKKVEGFIAIKKIENIFLISCAGWFFPQFNFIIKSRPPRQIRETKKNGLNGSMEIGDEKNIFWFCWWDHRYSASDSWHSGINTFFNHSKIFMFVRFYKFFICSLFCDVRSLSYFFFYVPNAPGHCGYWNKKNIYRIIRKEWTNRKKRA